MTDSDKPQGGGANETNSETPAQPKPAPVADGKDHGVLYIGMDLGTSRTAISASNGVRECLFSVVGYPKDHVAQKLLNKSVLVGKEAIEKRLSLDFHRPLEHGVLRNGDPGASRAAAGFVGVLVRGPMALLETLLVWQERAAERTRLRRMDDRMLSDMGLSRADVEREASVPFWRAT